MDPWTREDLLKVYNGEARTLPYLYHIVNHRGLFQFLKMLQRKGLTGSTLADFIQKECNGEPIRFLAFCVKEVQNTNVAKGKINADGSME